MLSELGWLTEKTQQNKFIFGIASAKVNTKI